MNRRDVLRSLVAGATIVETKQTVAVPPRASLAACALGGRTKLADIRIDGRRWILSGKSIAITDASTRWGLRFTRLQAGSRPSS